ncbi:MAG: hypothetical protein R3F59_05795 [Myxococcota bacterium]
MSLLAPILSLSLSLLACGGSDAPLRSEPTAPTVQFDEAAADGAAPVWTDLQGLFPERAAALPEGLAALQPGMNGARAREILEAAHQPGAKILGEMAGQDLVLSSILDGMPEALASLVLADQGKVLTEVQIELPDDVAVPMLTTRWGDPTEVQPQDDGKMRYLWRADGAPWVATLLPAVTKATALRAGEQRAVVRYQPAEPDAGKAAPTP